MHPELGPTHSVFIINYSVLGAVSGEITTVPETTTTTGVLDTLFPSVVFF